jgi:hypothetical protein
MDDLLFSLAWILFVVVYIMNQFGWEEMGSHASSIEISKKKSFDTRFRCDYRVYVEKKKQVPPELVRRANIMRYPQVKSRISI